MRRADLLKLFVVLIGTFFAFQGAQAQTCAEVIAANQNTGLIKTWQAQVRNHFDCEDTAPLQARRSRAATGASYIDLVMTTNNLVVGVKNQLSVGNFLMNLVATKKQSAIVTIDILDTDGSTVLWTRPIFKLDYSSSGSTLSLTASQGQPLTPLIPLRGSNQTVNYRFSFYFGKNYNITLVDNVIDVATAAMSMSAPTSGILSELTSKTFKDLADKIVSKLTLAGLTRDSHYDISGAVSVPNDDSRRTGSQLSFTGTDSVTGSIVLFVDHRTSIFTNDLKDTTSTTSGVPKLNAAQASVFADYVYGPIAPLQKVMTTLVNDRFTDWTKFQQADVTARDFDDSCTQVSDYVRKMGFQDYDAAAVMYGLLSTYGATKSRSDLLTVNCITKLNSTWQALGFSLLPPPPPPISAADMLDHAKTVLLFLNGTSDWATFNAATSALLADPILLEDKLGKNNDAYWTQLGGIAGQNPMSLQLTYQWFLSPIKTQSGGLKLDSAGYCGIGNDTAHSASIIISTTSTGLIAFTFGYVGNKIGSIKAMRIQHAPDVAALFGGSIPSTCTTLIAGLPA